MSTLYAKGLVKGDGLVAYLWGHGHYKYEIESIVAGKGRLTLCEYSRHPMRKPWRSSRELLTR